MKLRLAAAAAVAVGFALGILRSRRTRLRVVAPDGRTVRTRSHAAPSGMLSKPRAVAVLVAVRIRDALGVLGGWRDGEEATDALVVEMANDLAVALNEHRSQAV